MTDLRNGILCVEGFNLRVDIEDAASYAPTPETIISHGKITVSDQTTADDFRTAFGERVYSMGTKGMLMFKLLFLISDTPFTLMSYFDKEGRISRLEMTPCIRYNSPEEDRDGRVAERRSFCDKWLEEKLGAPDRNVGGAKYQLDNGLRIATVTGLDRENGMTDGKIVIYYM